MLFDLSQILLRQDFSPQEDDLTDQKASRCHFLKSLYNCPSYTSLEVRFFSLQHIETLLTHQYLNFNLYFVRITRQKREMWKMLK